MSDLNVAQNRAVWFDIPVSDLGRASEFYAQVLNIKVEQAAFGDFKLAVLEHEDGNGGCLLPQPDGVSSDRGVLLYLNANGRIRAAVAKAAELGGKVIEDTHPIGPHGFRAIVLDSEGNRIALHSVTDA